MLPTSTRLLKLLSLLQSRAHWTGSALTEHLEVDARTVRRDVNRLRDLGYPIHASSGLGGGYQLGAGSSMPPLTLDDDEAVTVAVALRAAAGSIGKMEETAMTLLAKLDQVLPARLRKRASALHQVTLSLGRQGPRPEVDLLTLIAAACRDQKTLTFGYADREGQASQRSVEPMRLAHTGYRWYLLAWDLTRGDWRTFRVDRVARPISRGTPFRPRQLPEDAATFVSRAITYNPYPFRVRLKLKGSVDTVGKEIPSWCGVLEPLDARHCVLDMGADSIHSLVALMALLSIDFEILSPRELIPKLARVTTRLQRSVRIAP
jgi:predicted DNA-binding transcriptional regulator YafY